MTLDEWTKEQVEVGIFALQPTMVYVDVCFIHMKFMRQNGNIKSNALYNPNETRHPPPANMVDSERDSELEKFIRG